MADLKISDAPEIPKEQLQDGTKIPTGGFGNYSVSVQTIRDWLVTYKDIATATSVSTVETNLSLHEANLLNPHQVTKSQVGLGSVDNTSDLSKPISTATQAALDLKSDKSTTYTKTETNTLLNDKSDKIYTYSKTEVTTLLNLKQEKLSVDGTLDVISSYDLVPSLDGIDGLPSSTMNQQAQALGNRDEYLNTVKADKATTAAGYGITDVYTKTEVDTGLDLKANLTLVSHIYKGVGSPNGVLTAPIGSIYTRTDGGANTTLYVKESGVGNTGWVAK